MISHNIIKKQPVKVNKYDVYKKGIEGLEDYEEEHSVVAEAKIKDMIDAM